MSTGKNETYKHKPPNGPLLLCLGLLIYFGFFAGIGLIAHGVVELHPLSVALGVILLQVWIMTIALFKRLGGKFIPKGQSHAAREHKRPNRPLLLILGLIIIYGFGGVFCLIVIGMTEDQPLLVALGAILLPVWILTIVLFRRCGGEFTPEGQNHSAWLRLLDFDGGD